ncbi:MAG TPA: hypothetical protein PLB89_13470 [Flavobacteriales bacterium]|nr:hypothetical protein [Flavobacteriales bacterium]
MHRAISVLLISLDLLALQAEAQDSRIIPGPPPDEYVDVTGDGRADLLITSRTVHITDPQQPGYLGKYLLGVRTLSGTAVLMWSTRSTQRWYTVEDSTQLDTGLLAKRIHFKQLRWTDEGQPTEFWLLERPFGPAITKDQDGWYGTGDHHNGHTMVLRSVNERGTSVAAFEFELPYPYGRVAINTKHAARVPNGYGEEGDPIAPKREPSEPPFDFGHEPSEPQVMVPPGVPPNEYIDLTSDEIPDLVITGKNAPHHAPAPPLGTYHRGIEQLPGTAFLMAKTADGSFAPFTLREGQELTPDQLTQGLAADRFRWAEPPRWPEFIEVLWQRYGSLRTADEPVGWLPTTRPLLENYIFRGTQYGRPMLGCFEVEYTTPGGELGLRILNLVDEGQVLRHY